MKTKTSLWITLILFTAVLLAGCQVASADTQTPSTPIDTPAFSTATPSPTLEATSTQQPTAEASVAPTVEQSPEQTRNDEAANAAQAYFATVSEGRSEEAADMLSSFSLAVFMITRGDATEALQAQEMDGVRWSDLKILGTQPFDEQTVLVHVTYSEVGGAASAPNATSESSAAAETVDVLWPMRLERGAWRYNWDNVIDFRTLDAEAQSRNDVTILPLRLVRYSDRIQLSLLIQNRTNETLVFGQVNETLGTFYFGDQPVVAEKTQWILQPLRAVPAATLEIGGLFTNLPDRVEIRRWNSYNVEPWFVFPLQ